MSYDNSNTPDYESLPAGKTETCEVTAVSSGNSGTLTINVKNEDDVNPDTNCPTAANVAENDDSVADQEG